MFSAVWLGVPYQIRDAEHLVAGKIGHCAGVAMALDFSMRTST
jgi:hypothetical protein